MRSMKWASIAASAFSTEAGEMCPCTSMIRIDRRHSALAAMSSDRRIGDAGLLEGPWAQAKGSNAIRAMA